MNIPREFAMVCLCFVVAMVFASTFIILPITGEPVHTDVVVQCFLVLCGVYTFVTVLDKWGGKQ